jgi:hypothetical protein
VLKVMSLKFIEVRTFFVCLHSLFENCFTVCFIVVVSKMANINANILAGANQAKDAKEDVQE